MSQDSPFTPTEVEARAILVQLLAPLRALPYADLVERFIDKVETPEIVAPSGGVYDVEVLGLWYSKREGTLRVVACTDRPGGRWWHSDICEEFIMAPDGTFIGE